MMLWRGHQQKVKMEILDRRSIIRFIEMFCIILMISGYGFYMSGLEIWGLVMNGLAMILWMYKPGEIKGG